MFGRIERRPWKYLIIFMIISLGIIPIMIAVGIRIIPFNLAIDTDSSDWLGFWATFGGNIIGLLGLALVTGYQDRKQNKQLEMQREIDNNRMKIDIKINLINKNIDDIRLSLTNINELMVRIRNRYNGYETDFKLYSKSYNEINNIWKEIDIIITAKNTITALTTVETKIDSLDRLADLIIFLLVTSEKIDKLTDISLYIDMLKELLINNYHDHNNHLEELRIELEKFDKEKVSEQVLLDFIEKKILAFRVIAMARVNEYSSIILELTNEL